MKPKVFIIEDDANLALGLQDAFTANHYDVTCFRDGEQGLEATLDQKPDLVVLDWMLPSKHGIDICKELRSNNFHGPILMLTCLSDEASKLLAFGADADDYLTKPFSARELLARVKALLRRATQHSIVKSDDEIKQGAFSHNRRARKIYYNGACLDLRGKEYQLLAFFLEHEGEALSDEKLMKNVWKIVVSSQAIRQCVSTLRKKIGDNPDNPKHIFTLHGHGYRFESGK